MKSKRFRVSMLVGVIAMLGATFAGVPAHASDDCATTGCWSAPFSRAGLWDAAPPATPAASVAADPAAASAVVLPNGQILYWNGLQNLENCGRPLASNAGDCAGNSKSEILDLTGTGNVQDHFYPVATNGGDDLFCSDQRLLADGRVVAAGGTHWEQELGGGPTPAPAGAPTGLAELYGSKNTHVFGGSWSQFQDMAYGRWYPTMITMPDGKLYVAGGTSKLLWNSSLLDPRASQPYPVNVNQTETLDPATGHWTYNGASADITLPQFARMHLLPDGEILYTGIGQMWGPAGESVDELKWNWESIYNPATKTWTQQALAQFGSRSGAFSAPLPIAPDANGNYSKAQYVIGGGVLGTDPGSELATNFSEIVTASANGSGAWTSTNARTGDMVNRRWYSSAVTLPNGQVLAFSGANVDEVVMPGIETAVHQAELYDPATGTWKGLSMSGRDRTYHNSALLLADGSVLVGGHAPINQGYGSTGAVANDKNGFSNNLKDPAFERFFPPALFEKARPVIEETGASATWGGTLDVELADGSVTPSSFVLSRLPSVTHTTDADNRTVIVKATSDGRNGYELSIPSNTVVPPGFYYVFAMNGPTPSVATIVKISGSASGGEAHPVNLVNTPLR